MDSASTAKSAAPLVVVMGVTGSGKTTVGTALAKRLQVAYVEGDALHPPANIAKMSAGVALTDADRQPWLASVAAVLRENASEGAVVACSALRRAYRDVLTQAAPQTVFLHLVTDPAVIRQRVAQRAHHFMPVSLVESQLAILEPLAADERGVVLDASAGPDAIVEGFLRRLDERS